MERLLAIDLDGTLLRRDQSIAIEDREAIVSAQRAGFGVVVATGRFPRAALPVAALLRSPLPAICADGAVIAGPERQRCLTVRGSGDFAAWCRTRGLAVFELGCRRLFYRALDERLRVYVRGWCEGFELCPGRPSESVVTSLAFGVRELVDGTLAEARARFSRHQLDVLPVGDLWALRLRHRRASKGWSLARLARSLGVPASRVAAVGNDYNDLSLFRASGRSFAMGDAPPSVRQAAGAVLGATAERGGGVAEAVRALLHELR